MPSSFLSKPSSYFYSLPEIATSPAGFASMHQDLLPIAQTPHLSSAPPPRPITGMNGSGPIRSDHSGRNYVQHHHPYMHARPPPAASTSTTSTQACAACKYQRRRCHSDCILAPYFLADQQQTFLNAHRLFGVSNITKILKHLDSSQHRDAMNSIIFHSNSRAKDPVYGCLGLIGHLHTQINACKAEIALINERIAMHRGQSESPVVDPANENNNSNTGESYPYSGIDYQETQQQHQQQQYMPNCYFTAPNDRVVDQRSEEASVRFLNAERVVDREQAAELFINRPKTIFMQTCLHREEEVQRVLPQPPPPPANTFPSSLYYNRFQTPDDALTILAGGINNSVNKPQGENPESISMEHDLRTAATALTLRNINFG